MTRVQSVVISAIVFAVVGYLVAAFTGASKKHDLGDQDCKGSSCNVNVMFKCTVFYVGCYTVVDYAMTRQKKNTDITWQITDSHFQFDTSTGGIVFKDQGSGFNCNPTGNQTITCKSSQSGLWSYTINVKGLDPFDPWVYQP